MRAVVYKKPFEVAVETVEDPKILHPNDVIVKITSSCICGQTFICMKAELPQNRE